MPHWAGVAIGVAVSLAVIGVVLWYVGGFVYFLARMSPGLVVWMLAYAGIGVLAWQTGIWWLLLLMLPITWAWMLLDD